MSKESRLQIVIDANFVGGGSIKSVEQAVLASSRVTDAAAQKFVEYANKVRSAESRISSLNSQLREGKITQESYNQSFSKARTALHENSAALRQYAQDIGVASNRNKSMLTTMRDLSVTAFAVVGTLQQVASGVKQLTSAGFDLARTGAQVTQMEQSFALMNRQIGISPSILGDMSAAARGTISDYDLMSSIFTLTAGSTKAMQRELTLAAPQLLEVSKAASKLNPELGDTEFMFQSISRGIKRLEFRLLDNLGLNIKIGEANKKHAEAIGKTVEELTAEEKTMALLNQTLEVGQRLIQQVGSDVASAVDPYEQLTTAMKEFRQELGQTFDLMAQSTGVLGGTEFIDGRTRALEYANALGTYRLALIEAGLSAGQARGRVTELQVAFQQMDAVTRSSKDELAAFALATRLLSDGLDPTAIADYVSKLEEYQVRAILGASAGRAKGHRQDAGRSD